MSPEMQKELEEYLMVSEDMEHFLKQRIVSLEKQLREHKQIIKMQEKIINGRQRQLTI